MPERKEYPRVIQCCIDQETFDALSEISREMQIGLSAILRMWIREKLREKKKL
ncbi:MAG: hypothetical protein ACOCP4_02030 [Candidatus Woesearchaeota archaeon]